MPVSFSKPTRYACHFQPHQPRQAYPPCQFDRRGRVARTARSHPFTVLEPRRKHLASGEHILRQTPDVPPGLYGVVREFAPARLPSRACRRPIRVDVRWCLARSHDLGNPGLGCVDGTPRPGRIKGHGAVRTPGPLCASHDPRLGEGRSAPRHRRPAARRFWDTPPSLIPLAGLVRASSPRGPWCKFHWHIQLPDRQKSRSRGHRDKCPRTPNGVFSARRHR